MPGQKSTGKILYFYPVLSTFIKKDIDMLSRHYRVLSRGITEDKKKLPFSLLGQLFFILKNIRGASIIICRFAGYHTVFPVVFGKLFGKKVLIVLGGTECHKFPSIGYGAQLKRGYRDAINFSLRNATMLLPVHESLIECKYDYDESGAPEQGCKIFCKGLKTPFRTINNGYDAAAFYYTGTPRIPNSFITVAANFNGAEFYRKGVDLIIETAKLLPDFKFLVIGNRKEVIEGLPSNVEIISAVPNQELKNYFSRYEFYLQLSLAEGFPNALCEAMLCGCIPIGANTFGIPDIIGDSGFVLKKKSSADLKLLIEKAVTSDKQVLSGKAVSRIRDNYPISKRENELLKLIKEYSAN